MIDDQDDAQLAYSPTERSGMNQNVPPYAELIRLGYCERYFDPAKPELSAGYALLRDTKPKEFKELMDFDYRQGRRDYIYRDNKSNELPGLAFHDGQASIAHLFPKTPDGRYLLAIATLLSKSYNQSEVADLLGVSEATISRRVDDIRVIMADYEAEL